MSKTFLISVIVPVTERDRDNNPRDLYHEYKKSLEATGQPVEFIYVVDGSFPEVMDQLVQLRKEGEEIVIVKLAKWFGEATALSAGFEHAHGEVILTLPAYYQVVPSEIEKVINELDQADMVIGRRWPRIDASINRLQSRVFHGLLRKITGTSFQDLGCGVRAFRVQVIKEVPVYGDQHRFLPLLASRRGFRVKEVDLEQSEKERFVRLHRPGIFVRRILDMLTVFFLIKFTKKPLRFFGLIGSATFALGGVFLIYLITQRLFMGIALADRPALLLSSLLVVLGVQIFALGLIGELIIFTHAKDMKEYTVETIINNDHPKQA